MSFGNQKKWISPADRVNDIAKFNSNAVPESNSPFKYELRRPPQRLDPYTKKADEFSLNPDPIPTELPVTTPGSRRHASRSNISQGETLVLSQVQQLRNLNSTRSEFRELESSGLFPIALNIFLENCKIEFNFTDCNVIKKTLNLINTSCAPIAPYTITPIKKCIETTQKIVSKVCVKKKGHKSVFDRWDLVPSAMFHYFLLFMCCLVYGCVHWFVSLHFLHHLAVKAFTLAVLPIVLIRHCNFKSRFIVAINICISLLLCYGTEQVFVKSDLHNSQNFDFYEAFEHYLNINKKNPSNPYTMLHVLSESRKTYSTCSENPNSNACRQSLEELDKCNQMFFIALQKVLMEKRVTKPKDIRLVYEEQVFGFSKPQNIDVRFDSVVKIDYAKIQQRYDHSSSQSLQNQLKHKHQFESELCALGLKRAQDGFYFNYHHKMWVDLREKVMTPVQSVIDFLFQTSMYDSFLWGKYASLYQVGKFLLNVMHKIVMKIFSNELTLQAFADWNDAAKILDQPSSDVSYCTVKFCAKEVSNEMQPAPPPPTTVLNVSNASMPNGFMSCQNSCGFMSCPVAWSTISFNNSCPGLIQWCHEGIERYTSEQNPVCASYCASRIVTVSNYTSDYVPCQLNEGAGSTGHSEEGECETLHCNFRKYQGQYFAYGSNFVVGGLILMGNIYAGLFSP